MISLKTNLPLRILLPTIYHDDSVLKKRLQMQSQANFFDNLRQSLDQKSYYGNFRVQLDVLLILPISHEHAHNVKRLEQIFKMHGCIRLVEENFVIAVIDSSIY